MTKKKVKPQSESKGPVVRQNTVHTIDYRGILYFMDDNMVIYKPEDIINNVINPTVIGQAVLLENGEYELNFCLTLTDS